MDNKEDERVGEDEGERGRGTLYYGIFVSKPKGKI